jgi:hypothetical protein
MLNKRITSLALAALTAASLAVPAFAAEEGTTAQTTESTTNRSTAVTGTYQAVDIAVVVPSTGTVVINPYALPVEIAKDGSTAITVKNQQIVTKPLSIKNKSDIALDINVSATATTKGALTLATAPIADVTTDTKNDAFVYLAIEESDLTGGTSTVTDTAIAKKYAEVKWTEYTAESTPANVLALKTSAVSKEKMGTLAAATLSNGTFSEYKAKSIAYIGLVGQCAQSPKSAWTTKDGLTANIAFTFTPHAEAAAEEKKD